MNHGSELRFIPPDLLEMLRICKYWYQFIEKRMVWRIATLVTRDRAFSHTYPFSDPARWCSPVMFRLSF